MKVNSKILNIATQRFKGILTLDIVNRHFLEDVPFYCNLDVFVFKLKQGKLQKEKDLVFYNNLSDAEGAVKFLAVGYTDYDCDHRIYVNISCLPPATDEVIIVCVPELPSHPHSSNQGFFQIKVTLQESLAREHRMKHLATHTLGFAISDAPLIIMQLRKHEQNGFLLEFPNLKLSHSIDDFIKIHEPTNPKN
jgi:stress response protein SCP2